jgi:hypothetical protein
MCFHENKFGQIDIFKNESDLIDIYKIIVEEHNKICPIGHEETTELSSDLFLLYNIKAELSRTEAEEDLDEEIDNYEGYDFVPNFGVTDDFEDKIRKKDTNKLIISKIEDSLIEIVTNLNLESDISGSPTEPQAILTNINVSFNVMKEGIVKDKENLGLNDSDLKYIFSTIYNNVYSKFLE